MVSIKKKTSLKKTVKSKVKNALKSKLTSKIKKVAPKVKLESKPTSKKVVVKSKLGEETVANQLKSEPIIDEPLPPQTKLPKMAKLVDDPCYGVLFNTLPECVPCYLRRSCQSTYQSQKKKAKQIQSGFIRRPIEKKYKMTEAYRPWR